jgi:hypothetical protein
MQREETPKARCETSKAIPAATIRKSEQEMVNVLPLVAWHAQDDAAEH